MTAFYLWRGRRLAGLTQAGERARYHGNPRRRAQVLARTGEWKARNPEKLRVHAITDRAVARGELVRRPCEVCGQKAHAHHAEADARLSAMHGYEPARRRECTDWRYWGDCLHVPRCPKPEGRDA